MVRNPTLKDDSERLFQKFHQHGIAECCEMAFKNTVGWFDSDDYPNHRRSFFRAIETLFITELKLCFRS